MQNVLAEMYATAPEKTASATVIDDFSKLAHAEEFIEIATQRGLDFSAMPAEKLAEMYAATFPEDLAKLAEEGAAPPFPPKKDEEKDEEEDKEDEEKEKEASAARAYWGSRREGLEKAAMVDQMGRQMARALVQELNNIQKEASGEQPDQTTLEQLAQLALSQSGPTKTASAAAFETAAANHALALVKQAQEAGTLDVDYDRVHSLVEAQYRLGLDEGVKVAMAQSYDQAVHFRALEYLEKVGFEINWG